MGAHEDGGRGSETGPGDVLRSREQLQRMLERVRAARDASDARTVRSWELLAESAALVEDARRLRGDAGALRAQLHGPVRESVAAYARALRADGASPERMVVLVKSAVQEGVSSDLGALDRRELMEDVVRWSIDAYYGAA